MNAKLIKNTRFLLIPLVILLNIYATLGQAQAGVMTSNPQPTSPASEMEAAWDAFFDQEMQAYGVHGAVMVAVRGNEVVFSKGYGYADAANQVPMDPHSTILRSGSIAKTLTATAVFQLAEQGKLDLEADINNYLTHFKIPDTFPEPVTARQLVNMIGGFDTRVFGIRAASLDQIIPLEEYLAERMPPRVLPPGRYRRYNDHELVLAGYLVQVISGMPYEDYVKVHIFNPLEMHDSSIYLPDEQLAHAARGYPVGGGVQDAYPIHYYYLNTAPGAGFNTTAADMAKYLIAHLQLGCYTRSDSTTVRILQESTASELHGTGFAHHPQLIGQANSFDEMFYNGQRYLRKSGGAPGMQNSLLLLPSEGMGFYLFTNTDGFALSNQWTQKVVETYLSPAKNTHAKTIPVVESNLQISPANYTGSYLELSDQTSHTTIVKVQALMDPDLWLQVSAAPSGGLQLGDQHYTPVDEVLFKDTSSGGYTAFELDKSGRANFLMQGRFVNQRVSWIETPTAQLAIIGTALLFFLTAALMTTVSILRGRSQGLLLAGSVSVLNLLFVVGLVIVMLPVATGGDKWQFSLEPSLALRAILAVPLLTTLISLALLVKTIIVWRRGSSSPVTRLLNTLLLFGMVGFLFFLHTWNLLGWKF
jgi:CubicO group peptidase (beta-lactamase class C family)